MFSGTRQLLDHEDLAGRRGSQPVRINLEISRTGKVPVLLKSII